MAEWAAEADVLPDVRRELEELVEARLLCPLSPEQARRYTALCETERRLLPRGLPGGQPAVAAAREGSR